MIFLFGWGHRTIKELGPALKNGCNNCKNEAYWNLKQVTTWFTLFFIPVIPYSTKRFLLCPICTYGFELDNEQFKRFKPLAESNKLLVDGKITQDEYANRINALSAAQTGSNALSQPDPSTASKVPPPYIRPSVCPKCGSQVPDNAAFCMTCGTKIPR